MDGYQIYTTLISAQDDDFLGPAFDQEKSGTADNLTPKQTHVFDWDKSIILDDIDEKPEAAINANSSSKDQYCVLSGELTPSTYRISANSFRGNYSLLKAIGVEYQNYC